MEQATDMLESDKISIFEKARPGLLGLAYRILGTWADAEDAVQDTYLKWQNTGKSEIENPAAWLRTICTRRCIDILRSAHKKRVDYVGEWLPEPVQTPPGKDVDSDLALANSLKTAFLLMLERLTPKERAAYLLREIFDVEYGEIAETLEIKESACRKLVSRARDHVEQARIRHTTPQQKQEQLLSAFELAVNSGETKQLAALLSDDIEIHTDGGGKVPAAGRVLRGKVEVLRFVEKVMHKFWPALEWAVSDINGGRGLILHENGIVINVVSFDFDGAGKIKGIYVMRNPDKLSHLADANIH